ncbi:MAG TPA: metallophosphoesterase family protein [candidate division Zixibacteria bacterium]|nr:metallophosphoesterase family protein [candidate division Zixibacteria bacterium]MDD4916175.1 metallophosphoesterase family protein [candidate division Zixibacteria bacterium]MDM7972342.1 metallophosphoesterase family protein [candidate division Zixibacteria bacterium]HOD67782.1 metallophosphoesterase family protein [candidate division Zixibacteria bacterium]HOZ07964.1 metallophosphoesterase family protein [candidate division Zixibacteria bacterium]
MRLALISDIHGNLEALTAVLRDIEDKGADEIACLGDVVGYGCDPQACLELVARTCRVKLLGNHDAAALGRTPIEGYNSTARITAEWTRTVLSDRDRACLESFTLQHRALGALLVHASPCRPDQWPYILAPDEAAEAFGAFTEPICFHGHTHIPAIFTEIPGAFPARRVAHDIDPHEESRYLINVGSVGQPRDRDPRACWTLYDAAEGAIAFRRVAYDIARTQSKMSEAHLPDTLVERLAAGR